MREIVLDTETTGLDPNEGHRIVEIGCIELTNRGFSGRNFHKYINPERDMPEEAFQIHGLSEDFLQSHPVFADLVEEFLNFIGDVPLVIHNAAFDLKFLNAELSRIGRPPLAQDRAVDTLLMVRQRFPGAPANLDALCRRFNVDNSGRKFHGALLDAELLAEVYLELTGGRQQGLELATGLNQGFNDERFRGRTPKKQPIRPPRPYSPTDAELTAHAAFLEKLENPLWLQ